jgi:hypothetical protein
VAGGVPGVQEDGKISGLARPDVQSSENVPLHFLRRSQAVNPGVLQTTQHKRQTSGADPDPDVFGPSRSGSGSTRYGSGSESFYHQAKIVRKTLIPTVL